MPRPGPRLYECVGRAWHSDRHQPMRGSTIQQIFRVANDAHSAATKKNKDWQEKLPIVVFKAEKANSETEYIDPETLWDRVNDAINIIIRRDENSETGELLPPCINAALNLGCIPVRASRSQRHSDPRGYLSTRVQEPASAAVRTLEKTTDRQCPQLSPVHSSSQSHFMRNSKFPVSESNQHSTKISKVAASCIYPLPNAPPGCNMLMAKETNKELNLGSVYPLYYGNDHHIKQNHMVSHVLEKNNCHTIFVGKPISRSVKEPTEMGIMKNLFVCPVAEIVARRFSQADLGNDQEKPSGIRCDLSLRLDLFTDPMGRSSDQEAEDLASSRSQDKGKLNDFSQQKNKELELSPGRNINDTFNYCPTKWFSEGEDQNLDISIRKRKTPFEDNVEDGEFCLPPEFPYN